MMNIFRVAADMTHLLSIIILLLKIHTLKSCAGISLKTQELYAFVFVTRYLDILTNHLSIYLTIMKFIFLASSFAIVWYIRYHKQVKQTYNRDLDSFKHYVLVAVSMVLALMFHNKFTFTEIMWTFSLYLEAVAILPQLVLLQTTSNVDTLTGDYVFFLGTYRGLYLLNWIYRYFTEANYVSKVRWITWISGFVQTALYADFFYYYLESWSKNQSLKLPS